MKRSDILTPIGMLLGIGLIVFAISQGNVGLAGFYDLVSVIITIINLEETKTNNIFQKRKGDHYYG